MSSMLFVCSNKEVSTIPFTDNLTINRKGEITGKNIKHFKKDGTWRVNLPIIFEDKPLILAQLDLGVLTSIVFKGYNLPWHWWGDIRLFYKDGDSYNIDPTNIAHQMWPEHFCYEFEGDTYKVIPGFTEYGISAEGVIYSTRARWETYRLFYGTLGTGDYTYFNIFCDRTGCKHRIGRHRTLALVYKDYPKEVDTLDTAHQDQNPKNDNLNNLEWETRKKNVTYGFHGLNAKEGRLKKALLYDTLNQTFKEFSNYTDCAKFITCNSSTITKSISDIPSALLYGRYRIIKLDKDIDELKALLQKATITHLEYITHGKVIVADCTEQIIYRADSLASLEKLLKLPIGSAYSMFNKPNGCYKVIPGRLVYIQLKGYSDYYGRCNGVGNSKPTKYIFTENDYTNQGTMHLTEVCGRVLLNDTSMVKIKEYLKLIDSGRHLNKLFKLGRLVIPNYKIYYTLPNLPNYYGGELLE